MIGNKFNPIKNNHTLGNKSNSSNYSLGNKIEFHKNLNSNLINNTSKYPEIKNNFNSSESQREPIKKFNK
jgi:hypothetical protein